MTNRKHVIVVAILAILAAFSTLASGRRLLCTEPFDSKAALPIVGIGPVPNFPKPTSPGTFISKGTRHPEIRDAMVARARTMGPKDVVFMGDSITYYLNANPNFDKYVTKGIAPRTAAILGVGGDKVENLWWRIAQKNPSAFPIAKVYVIGIGTNDLTLEPAEIARRISGLRNFIRSRQPKSYIVFTALWARNGYKDRIPAINEQLKTMVAGSDPLVSFVPWPYDYSVSHVGTTSAGVNWFLDGTHPINDAWIPVFGQLVPYIKILLARYGK